MPSRFVIGAPTWENEAGRTGALTPATRPLAPPHPIAPEGGAPVTTIVAPAGPESKWYRPPREVA